MEKSEEKIIDKYGMLIIFVYFGFFIIITLYAVIEGMIANYSIDKMEDKIKQQINNSKNNSIIFLNEYRACLSEIITSRPFSKDFNTIDIEKFNDNQEYIYDFCLSYQMKKHLKNDASRYDFLEKKVNEKGLTFHLKDEKFDYSKLY